jgi:hypothetical protein
MSEVRSGDVQRWRMVPRGALRGRCNNPDCEFPNCLDPFVTESELDGKPLIVVSYTNAEHQQCVKVNGKRIWTGGEETTKDRWKKVRKCFGELAQDAVEDHMSRRMEFMWGALVEEKHPGSRIFVIKPELDA